MLTMILLLIVGSFLVYISQYNFVPVTVNLGFYVFQNIPLFYVIAASLLVGLVLSYLTHLINAASQFFVIHGKDSEIKKNKKQVEELTKQVRDLEAKNEKLRRGTGVEPEERDALSKLRDALRFPKKDTGT